MAITDKEKGVWGLDQVYNKINQGSIWSYDAPGGDNHELWVWGFDDSGVLGLSGAGWFSSPVQIPGTTWSSVCGSQGNSYFLVATKTDNTLWAWGYNGYGNLGQNNKTYYSSPRQIPGTTWKSARRGTYGIGATKTDGTMWAWGYNQYGELGQNNLTKYSSPVQVGSDTTWDIVKGAGNRTLFVTKTDGTLWAWGYDGNGSLGQNSRTNYSSPVQVGSNTDWSNSTVAASSGRIHYLKSDGTLYATGYGGSGGLGQNNQTYYSSPVQIPGTTWKSVGSNSQATIASKTDGTLWAWGMNEYGSLGQNQAPAQLGQVSSPTQIPGTTWNTVSNPGAEKHIFVTKTDGTAWAWGENERGALGVNDQTDRSSPTQIVATDGWIGAMSGVGVYVGTGLRSL